MRAVAPQAALSLFLNAVDAAFNGILLAKQDYTFLLGAILPNAAILQVYTSLTADQGAAGLPLPFPRIP